MIDKHMLGIAIKNARRESHILSADLASKVGISRGHMSDIEMGKCCITVERLNQISEALEIPAEILILQAVTPKKSRHMRALSMLENTSPD